jgi:archaemetzincin
MEIDILPLENSEKVPKALLAKLAAELKKKDIKTRVLKAQKMPASAFDKSRGQYEAHKVLKVIDKKGVLAVTGEDIFDLGLNFVYGLADTEGSAVVSFARLKPEWYGEPASQEKLIERLGKECMHEVGHTLGLKHCTRLAGKKPCVMTFSTSIHEVDGKAASFCKEDAKFLE